MRSRRTPARNRPHYRYERRAAATRRCRRHARMLLPDIYRKLSIVPGSEGEQFAAHVRTMTSFARAYSHQVAQSGSAGMQVRRTRGFTSDSRPSAWRRSPRDFWIWKKRASLRLWTTAVSPAGVGIASRLPEDWKPAEQECVDRVTELDLPHRPARANGPRGAGRYRIALFAGLSFARPRRRIK